MPNKAPEDATVEELETFLRSHEVPIPAARHDPRYRPLLVERSKILLRIMGRETLRVERRSFLNRLISKTKKHTPTRDIQTEMEYALSVASEPVLARRRNAYERRRKPLDTPLETDFQEESEDELLTEPEYAEPPPSLPNRLTNQLRDLNLNRSPQKFSHDIPPPLPPRTRFFEPTSSDPTNSGSSSIEVPRLPQKKRPRQSDSQQSAGIAHDMSMRNIESTKIDHAPPVVVQPKPYTTKFTTMFNDTTDDIEQYLVALKRWQRLNNITDTVAISVGLQNFKSLELSNFTETSLSSSAFRSIEAFCEEVTRTLGKTQNQWLDIFDSIKRKNNESSFTFFARLQSVLKNALGVTKLNAEHERLIVRKFLKSVHPTLRGHLESRDEPITFSNAAMIANRIELALGLPKGGTVTEVHNIVPSKRPPQRGSNRAKYWCHICNNEGSHTTDYCFGNPNSANFDLEKFKVVNGVSKN